MSDGGEKKDKEKLKKKIQTCPMVVTTSARA